MSSVLLVLEHMQFTDIPPHTVGPGQFANSTDQLCSIDSSTGSGKLQVREIVCFIFAQHFLLDFI